jgi:hypothetical protein
MHGIFVVNTVENCIVSCVSDQHSSILVSLEAKIAAMGDSVALKSLSLAIRHAMVGILGLSSWSEYLVCDGFDMARIIEGMVVYISEIRDIWSETCRGFVLCCRWKWCVVAWLEVMQSNEFQVCVLHDTWRETGVFVTMGCEIAQINHCVVDFE